MKPLAELSVTSHERVLVARLDGEVDLSNVDEIRSSLVDAVTHDIECVVLDLTGTTYLDSTGVRLLFELAERLQSRRQQLRLVVADAALIRRVLVLTQLDDRVPLDASVDAALAAHRTDA